VNQKIDERLQAAAKKNARPRSETTTKRWAASLNMRTCAKSKNNNLEQNDLAALSNALCK